MTGRDKRGARWVGPVVLACLLAAPAAAQLKSVEVVEQEQIVADVRVERPLLELQDRIRRPPPDPDVADTALVFHNTRPIATRVDCVAFNESGQRLGAVWLRVAPRGVRFVLASDVSNDVDFIGSVTCRTLGHVLGTAVFLGGGRGLTDLRAAESEGDRSGLVRFPLVAHY